MITLLAEAYLFFTLYKFLLWQAMQKGGPPNFGSNASRYRYIWLIYM